MDSETMLSPAPEEQFRRDYLATFCSMKGWTPSMTTTLFGCIDGISGKGPANTVAWSEIMPALYNMGYCDRVVQRFGRELHNAGEIHGLHKAARSKEGLRVIAIGPRGGKIVGYVGGNRKKPIYEGSAGARKMAGKVEEKEKKIESLTELLQIPAAKKIIESIEDMLSSTNGRERYAKEILGEANKLKEKYGFEHVERKPAAARVQTQAKTKPPEAIAAKKRASSATRRKAIGAAFDGFEREIDKVIAKTTDPMERSALHGMIDDAHRLVSGEKGAEKDIRGAAKGVLGPMGSAWEKMEALLSAAKGTPPKAERGPSHEELAAKVPGRPPAGTVPPERAGAMHTHERTIGKASRAPENAGKKIGLAVYEDGEGGIEYVVHFPEGGAIYGKDGKPQVVYAGEQREFKTSSAAGRAVMNTAIRGPLFFNMKSVPKAAKAPKPEPKPEAAHTGPAKVVHVHDRKIGKASRAPKNAGKPVKLEVAEQAGRQIYRVTFPEGGALYGKGARDVQPGETVDFKTSSAAGRAIMGTAIRGPLFFNMQGGIKPPAAEPTPAPEPAGGPSGPSGHVQTTSGPSGPSGPSDLDRIAKETLAIGREIYDLQKEKPAGYSDKVKSLREKRRRLGEGDSIDRAAKRAMDKDSKPSSVEDATKRLHSAAVGEYTDGLARFEDGVKQLRRQGGLDDWQEHALNYALTPESVANLVRSIELDRVTAYGGRMSYGDAANAIKARLLSYADKGAMKKFEDDRKKRERTAEEAKRVAKKKADATIEEARKKQREWNKKRKAAEKKWDEREDKVKEKARAGSWKASKGTVNSVDGPVEVDAHHLGGSGLFVHKTLSTSPARGSKWVLTHEGTGSAAGRFSSRKAAMDKAAEIYDAVGSLHGKDVDSATMSALRRHMQGEDHAWGVEYNKGPGGTSSASRDHAKALDALTGVTGSRRFDEAHKAITKANRVRRALKKLDPAAHSKALDALESEKRILDGSLKAHKGHELEGRIRELRDRIAGELAHERKKAPKA